MPKVYKTDDQGFAAYLMYKGNFLIDAVQGESADTRRKDFIFTDVENFDELKSRYESFTVEPISALGFALKFRTAGKVGRQGKSREELGL